MTQAHPNRLQDNLISLITFPTSRQSEGLQNSRTKIYLSDRHFSSSQYQQMLFIQLIYSCFLITIFPPIAKLHFLHLNTHTTHNSFNHCDEGLTLENQLIIQNYIAILSPWCSTTVSLETYPLYPPAQQSSTQHEWQEKKDSSVLISKIYVTECYHGLIQVTNKRQESNISLIT